MAQLTGRPTPPGGGTFHATLSGLDTRPHPLANIAPRVARPYNYSPLGPSTRHLASPLKNPRVK